MRSWVLGMMAVLAVNFAVAQDIMTREEISARVVEEKDETRALVMEQLMLTQWTGLKKTELDRAVKSHTLRGPRLDELRKREQELLHELSKVQAEIAKEAREHPQVKEKQKELDDANVRLMEVTRKLKEKMAPEEKR